jgi:hypothetical protein
LGSAVVVLLLSVCGAFDALVDVALGVAADVGCGLVAGSVLDDECVENPLALRLILPLHAALNVAAIPELTSSQNGRRRWVIEKG